MNLAELEATLRQAAGTGAPALVVRAESAITPPLELTDADMLGAGGGAPASSSSSSSGFSLGGFFKRLLRPFFQISAPAFGVKGWTWAPAGRPDGWRIGFAIVVGLLAAIVALAVVGVVALVKGIRSK